eukprot:626390_1
MPFDNTTSILWQGIIFENIQSLRHFYDSKQFVDHVLKTSELLIINEYFTDHVLNYSSQSHHITRHRSFCDTATSKQQDLQQSKQLVTQNNDCSPHHIKRSSFPSTWNPNKHRTITDEFIHKFFFTPGFELLAGQIPSDWTDTSNTALFTQILIPKNDEDIMVESSIKMVENLADLANRFGFVPNGTRKYYLDRSQPPLMTLMVHEVYHVTKDKQWLKSILPSLVKEYKYWTSSPMQVSLVSETDTNKVYPLARYYTSKQIPRPESYYEDCMTALVEKEDARPAIYQNIRAAAASGWDLSSRWYYDQNGAYGDTEIVARTPAFNEQGVKDDDDDDSEDHLNVLIELIDRSSLMVGSVMSESAMSANEEIFDEFAQQRMQFKHTFSLTKTDTIHVIPVDLNVFLCKVEGCLSMFFADIGDKENADKFKSYQDRRVDGVMSVLWDEDGKQFRDYNFRYKCFGNMNVASNFIPLWLSCDDPKFNEKKVLLMESLSGSGLIQSGGIVTSLCETGEQWDYPNVWAPLNHIIIDGLYHMGQTEYALRLANSWLNNNYHTFLASNKMQEKYHCNRYGTGGGGEYKPQVGFGWTNGVCLKLMELFGSKLTLK